MDVKLYEFELSHWLRDSPSRGEVNTGVVRFCGVIKFTAYFVIIGVISICTRTSLFHEDAVINFNNFHFKGRILLRTAEADNGSNQHSQIPSLEWLKCR